jgi:hypothetical protein
VSRRFRACAAAGDVVELIEETEAKTVRLQRPWCRDRVITLG